MNQIISMYSNKRDLDGVFFRVKRKGKWDNVCWSDLTEPEMREIIQKKSEDPQALVFFTELCVILGQALREIGDEFDLYNSFDDDWEEEYDE